jgi:hypothetical protein
MRATTLLRRLVDVTGTRVTGVRFFSREPVRRQPAPHYPLDDLPDGGPCYASELVHIRLVRDLRQIGHPFLEGPTGATRRGSPWHLLCAHAALSAAYPARCIGEPYDPCAYHQVPPPAQRPSIVDRRSLPADSAACLCAEAAPPQPIPRLKPAADRHRRLQLPQTAPLPHHRGGSRLQPFVRVARTLRAHFDGVLAYIRHRLTNGLAEGLNNKLRIISRRAYGFHSADALIAMLFLNSGGIELSPRLPPPTPC